MVEETPFKPRLGRPGNRGAGAGKGYSARVRKAAARLAMPRSNSRFTDARYGRGSAAARVAAFRSHPFAKFRMRRVIVKTHIARAGRGIGNAAFRAHIKYIQRDGVAKSKDKSDTRGGDLYDRDGEKLDDRAFLTRSENDRRQFRIILSPEDADRLGDLKENTRAFMAQMERDLGTRLDWVAVDHHNTGNSHTHIVICGKDERGKDLLIAREYITHGMRRTASDIVTIRLGPRRDMEIVRARNNEVTKERFTGIDREIASIAIGDQIEIKDARGVHGRFERSLLVKRLRELEKMHLATPAGPMQWRLDAGWDAALKKMGRRGDIIRSISAAMGEEEPARNFKLFDGSDPAQKPVLGRVAAIGPDDELRDTRFLVIEGLDGAHWHLTLGASEPGVAPPIGAVIEVRAARAEPKRADKVIAEVASGHDGVYSEGLHAALDPTSTAAYREAHKRRLEALRRAGFVERETDGSWRVGRNYLEKAARYEAARSGNATLDVKSWLAIDELVTRDAMTWLDGPAPERRGVGAFAAEVDDARGTRINYLMRKDLLGDEKSVLSAVDKSILEAKEQRGAAKAEAQASRRAFVLLKKGRAFSGVYERPVDLAQGRFAIIGKAKEFTLVPWRSSLERQRGRVMIMKGTANGVQWIFEKKRGLSR